MAVVEATQPTQQQATAAALERIGLTPQALVKIARTVANDYKRLKGAQLGDKDDDFVSYIIVVGLQAALRYDPAKADGDQGVSFIWKIMQQRCDDFFRRKSEGFGDSRHGNNGRLVLKGNLDLDELLKDDDDVDIAFDLDLQMRAGRVRRWAQAAERCKLPVAEWVLITLDRAAERQAA